MRLLSFLFFLANVTFMNYLFEYSFKTHKHFCLTRNHIENLFASFFFSPNFHVSGQWFCFHNENFYFYSEIGSHSLRAGCNQHFFIVNFFGMVGLLNAYNRETLSQITYRWQLSHEHECLLQIQLTSPAVYQFLCLCHLPLYYFNNKFYRFCLSIFL